MKANTKLKLLHCELSENSEILKSKIIVASDLIPFGTFI